MKSGQFQNLRPVPLPGARGIRGLIEPKRVDAQSRNDIGNVPIVKISRQEKGSSLFGVGGNDFILAA